MIWKTDGLREANTKKLILYFAGGSRIPYTGWNHPDIMMLSASNESWWNYTDVMRWCYADDLIAQADKAERLEEENEAMREEFEVWHGNYMCVVEDKERLEQAVQYLKRLHIATIEKYNPKEKELAEQTIDYAIEMAIEHKE